MMQAMSYEQRRGEIETYFDRTAARNWIRLSSDATLGGIRERVRQGRVQMRQTLLAWLPDDLSGQRVLDAGCGTGLLAVEAVRRGAKVTAVDLSAALLEHARTQLPGDVDRNAIEFRVGDMLQVAEERFDYLVAMDSLIHYPPPLMVELLGRLARCTRASMLFTFVPATFPLAQMHALGRLFPRGNRAPAVEPVAERSLRRMLDGEARLSAWRTGRSRLVQRGFYASQAMELLRR